MDEEDLYTSHIMMVWFGNCNASMAGSCAWRKLCHERKRFLGLFSITAVWSSLIFDHIHRSHGIEWSRLQRAYTDAMVNIKVHW